MIKLVGDWRVLPQNVWKSTHAQGSLGAGRRATGVGVGKLYRKLYRKLYWKLYRKLYWNNLDQCRQSTTRSKSWAVLGPSWKSSWGRLAPSWPVLKPFCGVVLSRLGAVLGHCCALDPWSLAHRPHHVLGRRRAILEGILGSSSAIVADPDAVF